MPQKMFLVLLWMTVGTADCLTMQGNIHRVSSKYGKRGLLAMAANKKRFRNEDELSQGMYGIDQVESIIQMKNVLAGANKDHQNRLMSSRFTVDNDNFPPRVGKTMISDDANEQPRVGRSMMTDNDAFPPRVGRSMTMYDYTRPNQLYEDMTADIDPVYGLPPRTGRTMVANDGKLSRKDYIHSRTRRSLAIDIDDKPWAPRVGRKEMLNDENHGPLVPRVGKTVERGDNHRPLAPRVGRVVMTDDNHRPLAPHVGKTVTTGDNHVPLAPRVGRVVMTGDNHGPFAPRVGRTTMAGNNHGSLTPRVGRMIVTDDNGPLAPRVGKAVVTEDNQGPFAPRVGRVIMTNDNHGPFAPRVGRTVTTDNNHRPIAPRVGRTIISDKNHSPEEDKIDAIGRSFLPRSGRDHPQSGMNKRKQNSSFPPGMVATGYSGKDMNDANLVAEILQALSETEYPDAFQE